MSYGFAVAIVAPADAAAGIEALVESLGLGECRLGVPAVTADGRQLLGCVTWAAESFVALLSDPQYAQLIDGVVWHAEQGL